MVWFYDPDGKSLSVSYRGVVAFWDPAPAVFVRMFTNWSKAGSLFLVLFTLLYIASLSLNPTLHLQWDR